MTRFKQLLLKLWSDITKVSYVRKTEEQFALETAHYLRAAEARRPNLPNRGAVRH